MKVASYFTVVLPLLFLAMKAALRWTRSFSVISPAKELGNSVDVDPQLIAKIQQLFSKIQRKEADPQIQWLATHNSQIFRLPEAPHLVFKMNTSQGVCLGRNGQMLDSSQVILARYANMVRAKEVCLVHQLGLLTIPQARLFWIEADGERWPVIAEQALNIRHAESAQEESYRAHAHSLSQAARQLGAFIAETGFNDVDWRNIPVLEEAAGFQGERRIGLIDLEHMERAEAGILGSYMNGSRGLVRCLFAEEDIDAVLKSAIRRGMIGPEEAERVKARRREEIGSIEGLRAFYERTGIEQNPRKPLEVDLETLGLNLEEVGQVGSYEADGIWRQRPVTLRKVAQDTVVEINRQIQGTAEGESTKGKRYILLNTNDPPFLGYNRLGAPGGFIRAEDADRLWLQRILTALVNKGHLYQLVKVTGNGYFIQA